MTSPTTEEAAALVYDAIRSLFPNDISAKAVAHMATATLLASQQSAVAEAVERCEAEIVAWLACEGQKARLPGTGVGVGMLVAADAIKRGEHRSNPDG